MARAGKLRFWLECKVEMGRYDLRHFYEKAIRDIVWHLPSDVVYWAAIRLAAHATTGEHGNTAPDDLTFSMTMRRWNDPLGGDRKRAQQLLKANGGKLIYVDVAITEEPATDPYPEHSKRAIVAEDWEKVRAFLEWCGENRLWLATFDARDHIYFPNDLTRNVLARYYDIDVSKIEAERKEMLTQQRNLNAEEGAASEL